MALAIYKPTNVRVKAREPVNVDNRLIVVASLGCHVVGAAMPHADISCPKTILAGAIHRFLRPMPPIIMSLYSKFEQFVWMLIEETEPLPPDTDVTFLSWIWGTLYPLKRKLDLITVEERVRSEGGLFGYVGKNYNCEASTFGKDEPYPEYKHIRNINGRVDETKVSVGPFFKAIEKEEFSDPCYIKKIPINDRPAYILKTFEGPGTIRTSDFTSLEATFQYKLMLLEVRKYKYATRNLPNAAEFHRFCDQVLNGENKCKNKWFTLWIEARRLSGEMNTSGGNGWFNKAINMFAYAMIGVDHRTVPKVIEGDDGLFQSPTNVHPQNDFYTKLGCIIKLEEVTNVSEASFCGLIFDEVERTNIANPRKILATAGVTSHQYAHAKEAVQKTLLRSKALSIAYQYPRSPIMSALASYMLRVTSGRNAGVLKMIAKEKRHKWSEIDIAKFENGNHTFISQLRFDSLIVGKPGMRTRLLMEKIFDVSVEQQLQIEAYLDSLTELQPLNIGIDFPPDWCDYASRFTVNYKRGGSKVPFEPQNVRHLDLSKYCKLEGETGYYT